MVKRKFLRKKALAWMLVAMMTFSATAGANVSPVFADEAGVVLPTGDEEGGGAAETREIVTAFDATFKAVIADGLANSYEWDDAVAYEFGDGSTLKFTWDDDFFYVLAEVKGNKEIKLFTGVDNDENTASKCLKITKDGEILEREITGQFSFQTWGYVASESYNAVDGVFATKTAIADTDDYRVEAAISKNTLGITCADSASFGIDALLTGGEADVVLSAKAKPSHEFKTTIQGWSGAVELSYDPIFVNSDLTTMTLSGKGGNVAGDIGRYDLIRYVDSFEKNYVADKRNKNSFDSEKLTTARSYALSEEATAEGIAAKKAELEEMRIKILEDNGIDAEGRTIVNYGTPFVDGVVDDVWENANEDDMHVITDKEQPGTVKMLWDENALYYLVEVNDPTFDISASAAHEKDSVEFFIMEPEEAKVDSFGKYGGQWRINRGNITTVTFGSNEDFYAKLVEKADGTGYIVEARLNLRNLNAADGKVLNTDATVNLCADGKRTSTMGWHTTDGYSHPSTTGQIILSKSEGNTNVAGETNPYKLMKLLDKALLMNRDDYDAESFDANYNRETIEGIYNDAVEGKLSAVELEGKYKQVVQMMSKITYDGVHKSVLGFEAKEEFPDTFTMKSGKVVESTKDWEKRAAEIQDDYEFYMYGKLPTDSVATGTENSVTEADETSVKTASYTVDITRGEVTKSFDFTVYFPKTEPQKGGYPYIINFGGNIEGAQDAGYAVISYSNNSKVAADNSHYSGVFYDLYPECVETSYQKGVGPLAARAWGVGRILDVVYAGVGELSTLNAANSAVTGFSYLGKNALVTGALEKRIAVTNPAHSGIGGAAMMRWTSQGKNYTAEDYGFDFYMTRQEPMGQVQGEGMKWVKPIFADFIGAENLPFETYMLMSLCAPRGLIITAGHKDQGTCPEGMYGSYLNALETYNFLDASGNIAYADFDTAHATSTAEWQKLFEFCDGYFGYKPFSADFYDCSFDNSPDKAEYYKMTAPEKKIESFKNNYAGIIVDGVAKEEEWKNSDTLSFKDGSTVKLSWDDDFLYIYEKVLGDGEVSYFFGNDDTSDVETKFIKVDKEGKLLSRSFGYNRTSYSASPIGFGEYNSTEDGYEVEIAIRLSDLGLEAADGVKAGIDAILTSGGKEYFLSNLHTKPSHQCSTSVEIWGMKFNVNYDPIYFNSDLTELVFAGKGEQSIKDIGRYEFVKYIDSYEADYVADKRNKESFNAELLSSARAYALSTEATAEGLAAKKAELEAMRVKILADNNIDAEGHSIVNYGTPIIDGVIDEIWANATEDDMHVITDKEQPGTVKALWDENALYYLIEVNDPTFDISASAAHEKDSVEFFFMEPEEAAANSFGKFGGQWRINRGNITTVTFGSNEDFYAKLVEKADKSGYIVEARFNLKNMNPKDGKVLNTDVTVNLCDGGKRTSTMGWHTTDGYSNPRTTGQIILKKAADITTVAEDVNPYKLIKLLDKALVMDAADYDEESFKANYDKELLEKAYTEAISGKLSTAELEEVYASVVEMMSGITYDGVHKSVLGFEAKEEYPDTFTFKDGTAVTDPSQWSERAAEIQDDYEFYMYGKLPTDSVATGTEDSVKENETNIEAAYTVNITRGEASDKFTFTIYLPKGTAPEGGWPYIINYGGNIDGAQAAGYAVISYSANGTVAADNSHYSGVFYNLYPECVETSYQKGVGPLAARAWGVGRILDVVYAGVGELAKLNPNNSAVTGFSYLGKTALVTGALEKRIAVTNPAHSGIGGAAMMRWTSQGKNYTAEEYGFDFYMTRQEPMGQVQGEGMKWVKPIFADFIGAENLPFETYMLMSLCAPRGLIITAGHKDQGTCPEGMYGSYLNARETYKFLGSTGNIAYADFDTAHATSTAEWNKLFEFCDNYFGYKKAGADFYNCSFDNSPDKAEYYVMRAPEVKSSPVVNPTPSQAPVLPAPIVTPEPTPVPTETPVAEEETKAEEGKVEETNTPSEETTPTPAPIEEKKEDEPVYGDNAIKKASSKKVLEATQEKGKFVDAEGTVIKKSLVKTADGTIYYANAAGNISKNAIVKVGSKLYCTNDKGIVITNKVVAFSNGSRAYADKSGKLLKNNFAKAPNGKMVYADENGILQTGIFEVDGKKYYASKYGNIQVNKKVTINGIKYSLGADGVVIKETKVK